MIKEEEEENRGRRRRIRREISLNDEKMCSKVIFVPVYTFINCINFNQFEQIELNQFEQIDLNQFLVICDNI